VEGSKWTICPVTSNSNSRRITRNVKMIRFAFARFFQEKISLIFTYLPSLELLLDTLQSLVFQWLIVAVTKLQGQTTQRVD
jgi:hypothetical protein